MMSEQEQLQAIETIEQALLEIKHAREVGPGWYTRGAAGRYAQVSMWVHKAHEALEKLREALR